MTAVFWKVVGVALLGWVAYDIYAGYTLVWDVVHRDRDPVLYWIVVGVWFVLAVYCLLPSGKKRDWRRKRGG